MVNRGPWRGGSMENFYLARGCRELWSDIICSLQRCLHGEPSIRVLAHVDERGDHSPRRGAPSITAAAAVGPRRGSRSLPPPPAQPPRADCCTSRKLRWRGGGGPGLVTRVTEHCHRRRAFSQPWTATRVARRFT